VDDTVGALDIHRVVGVGSEGLFSDDDVVDEVLADGISVLEGSGEGGQVGGFHVGGGDVAGYDVHLENIGIDRSPEHFVRLDGRVDGCEDGVGTRTGQFVGDTGGFESIVEEVEVVVFLEFGLLLADGDTFGTPDLTRSLEGGEGVQDTARSTGSGGRSRSGRGSGGGSRGGCGGGRSGGSCTGTLLHVFFEAGGLGDGFAGILVDEGIRITGIGHTTLSNDGSIEQDRSRHNLLLHVVRGEGRNTDEGRKGKDDFLSVDNEKDMEKEG